MFIKIDLLDKTEIIRYRHIMDFYRAHFTFWQVILVLVVLVQAFFTFGCNGTRFLFSADKEVISTPAELGLNYDEVWFDTKDEIPIHGWSIPGQADMPLVIFFHGNAANISHFVDILRYFNEMGFSTFIFDYRGFGKSHGQVIREEDLYIDGRSAIDYLRSKGWQPSQMIFYGHSMGAAVSLQMGLETPPAAVVLESPFTSMSEIAWHTAPVTYALIGWWAIDAEFDNLKKIQNLSVPLVIFQGGMDKIVPPKMAQRLYKHAREPKAIYFIPNGGHSDLFQVGGEKYKNAWIDLVRYWVSTQNRKVCLGFY
jgi:alpha-beta hydrolase superfamily lysophospholipase